MKKTIWFHARLIFSLVVMLSSFNTAKAISAVPVKLAWDASPDAAVAGYALYYRLAEASVTSRLDLGPAQAATLFDLDAGSDYLIYVVAYDTAGVESSASNVLSYRPLALTRLQISEQTDGTMNIQFSAAAGALCRVEFASSLASSQWQTLGSATADKNGEVLINDPLAVNHPLRFYRGVRQ